MDWKKALLEIHQKFLIPLGTENRGGYDPEYTEIKALECPAKVIDDRLMEVRITNNAALTHQPFSYLKLRLDKADDVAGPFQEFQNSGDHNLQRDEGDVKTGKIHTSGQGTCIKVSDIGPFYDFDPRLGSQVPVELAVAHIYCCHVFCTVLEKTIGEPPGGGPNIKASEACNINVEGTKGSFEFCASSAYIGDIPASDLDGTIDGQKTACLGYSFTIHIDLTSKDECEGTLTALDKSPFDQKEIQTLPGGFHTTLPASRLRSTQYSLAQTRFLRATACFADVAPGRAITPILHHSAPSFLDQRLLFQICSAGFHNKLYLLTA